MNVHFAIAAGESYCNRPSDFQDAVKERRARNESLKEGKIERVETQYSGLVVAYERGVRSSSEMDGMFTGFNDPDPRLEPMFLRWMKEYPRSYAARIAYGRHLYQRAFAKRGEKWAGETSDEQMAGMAADMKLMLKVLDEGDALTTKPVLSYALRLAAGRALGWPKAELERLLAAAVKVDPVNSFARIEYMNSLMVKWGGEEGSLERYRKDVLASSLPKDIKDVINYRGLAMEAEDLNAYAAKDPAMRERAVRLFEQADATCSAFTPGSNEIVSFYIDKRDFQAALRYLDGFQTKRPTDPWAFSKRASVFWKMGLERDSYGEYKRAAEAGDASGINGLAWFYETGKVVPRDLRHALELYEAAARKGSASARDGSERVRKRLASP